MGQDKRAPAPAAKKQPPTLPAPRGRSTTTSYPTTPAQAETAIASAASGEGEHTGQATYFADTLNGLPTASGESFSNDALTAAHHDLPFGTRLRVTNLRNRKSVVVRVNDRRSFRQGFVITVTRAAAGQLGFVQAGSARVRIEVVR
jgi:rare lipoprotein A